MVVNDETNFLILITPWLNNSCQIKQKRATTTFSRIRQLNTPLGFQFQQLPAASKVPSSSAKVREEQWDRSTLGPWLIVKGGQKGTKGHGNRCELWLPSSSDCFSPPAVSFGMRRAGLLIIQSSPFSDSCVQDLNFDVLGIQTQRRWCHMALSWALVIVSWLTLNVKESLTPAQARIVISYFMWLRIMRT